MLKTMFNNQDCNLCGASEFIPLYEEKAKLDSEIKFTLVKCKECELMFVHPQPPQEMKGWLQLPLINDRILITQGAYKHGVYHYLCGQIQKHFKHTLEAEYKILDIGCGIGEFLNHCAGMGWGVAGVEPALAQAAFAQQRGLPVLHGYFSSFSKEAFKYNVLTLLDVLEHVNNPSELLKEIYESIVPNTLLIIRVPYGPFQLIRAKMFKILFRRDTALLGVKDHLFQFSDKTIKQFLEKTGFKVLKIEPSVYETTRRNNRVLNVIKKLYILMSRLYYYLFKGIISNSMIVYAVK